MQGNDTEPGEGIYTYNSWLISAWLRMDSRSTSVEPGSGRQPAHTPRVLEFCLEELHLGAQGWTRANLARERLRDKTIDACVGIGEGGGLAH